MIPEETQTTSPENPEVDPANTVIQVRGLSSRFGDQVIHEGLDLEVRQGEILGLVGGSGSGKTTLLRAIIMLGTPAAGSIRVFGEEVIGLGEAAADRLRRRFGVMFQQGALFSSLTVLENVEAPLREHTRLSAASIREIAHLKVALAGLPTRSAALYPRELSGGMIKRAAVARALALDPALLFLDEPSAGLDPVSANGLDELVVQLRDALELTIVVVTHDLDSLWRTTDRVAFLGQRRVLALDTINNLSRSPLPELQAYFQGPRGRAAAQH